jgi:hypothetical protein
MQLDVRICDHCSVPTDLRSYPVPTPPAATSLAELKRFIVQWWYGFLDGHKLAPLNQGPAIFRHDDLRLYRGREFSKGTRILGAFVIFAGALGFVVLIGRSYLYFTGRGYA